MAAPAMAVITGTFPASVNSNPAFVPSCPVSFGASELLPDSPVTARISGGALTALDGSPLSLQLTSGSPIGPTGFWFWTCKGLPGVPDFSFFLTGDADISALIHSPASGGGAVASVNGRTGAVVLSAAEVGALPQAGGAMGGHLAPMVVTLADAAAIAVDASLGNDFRVTLGGNRTLAAPSNPADGQSITFEIVQDATGSRTLAWDAAYRFGSGGAPVLSTAAGAVDLVAFRYSAAKSAWLYLGAGLGF